MPKVQAPTTAMIHKIEADPLQPRKDFDQTALDELGESIKTCGLLQPIIVRRHNGGYRLIAGERRLRACQGLGWKKIPIIIRETTDKNARRLQMLENVARKDLTPVELAKGFQQMLDEGFTVKEIADSLGKKEYYVTYLLETLECREDILHLVARGQMKVDVAHSLSRLSLDGQMMGLRRIQQGDFGYRESAIVCEALYMRENQADAFPETKVSEAEVKMARQVKDALERAGEAFASIQRQEGAAAGLVGEALSSETDAILSKLGELKKAINWLEKSVMIRRANMLA